MALKFAYLAGEPLGVPVAKILAHHGFIPEVVVCNPDRPRGRGRQLTAPPIKAWAQEHGVPVFQPLSWREREALTPLTETTWDVLVVVAYNHILPGWLINLPTHGVLNLHPSLLPKLRGPSPIRTAILNDQPESVGVTIMQMDTEMDHGPIIAQQPYPIEPAGWPIDGQQLDTALATAGAELLAECLQQLAVGTKLPTIPQDHEAATYTQRLTKSMGELSIDPFALPTREEADAIYRRAQALAGWPGVYFFYNGTRIKIQTMTRPENGSLRIETVIPEGKPPTPFTDWVRSLER